jgi:hypothetical protein
MPFSANNGTAALDESLVQDVRVVCDRYQRCWNTNARRTYRAARPYYSDSYYNNRGYYGGPGYGYYSGPRVGVGIGPLGFGVW